MPEHAHIGSAGGNALGYLGELEITNQIIAARPRRKTDTVDYRRKKLIANIEEQIELANLALQEKPLIIRRKRGHSIVDVKPRLWWNVAADGNVYTQIRFNRVAINIDGRGTSIAMGTLKELPAVFRTVINAVEVGELDGAIESVTIKERA